MREAWKFDRESLIDSCLNPELIEEIGLDSLVEVAVVEFRKVKLAPHIATYVHLIDTEPVYLRLIGKGWVNGRVRPALMVAYTLYKRRIEPLWVFKAADREEVHEEDTFESGSFDSGLVAPRWLDSAPRARSHSDAPLPDKVARELERVVRSARRRRKH